LVRRFGRRRIVHLSRNHLGLQDAAHLFVFAHLDNHLRLVIRERLDIGELDLRERDAWVLRETQFRYDASIVDLIIAKHVAVSHLIGERTGRH
jgi:hypothetical protein